MLRRMSQLGTWVLLAGSLAGCGGGGDSASTAPYNPPNTIVIGSIVPSTPNPLTAHANTFTLACSGGKGTLTYRWDFGDGTPASTDVQPAHSFTAEGNYLVSATCTDVNGSSQTRQTWFTVGTAITPSIPASCTGKSAGTGWCALNPLLNQSNLKGISMVSSQVGWAVGSNGFVISTVDGGTSWKVSAISSAEKDLVAIAALDANTAWAVGASGRVITTTDGGVTWVALTPFVSGAKTGLRAIARGDAQTLWVVGDQGTIVKSSDAGVTWASQNVGTQQSLRAVAALDANTAWAVGANGTVLKTADGGTTWTIQSSGTSQTLNGIAVQDADTLVAVGDNGTVIQSTSGGTTWTARSSNTTQTLAAATALGSGQFLATGYDASATANSAILQSTDGGANWSSQYSGTTLPLRGLAKISATTAWIAGDQGMLLNNANTFSLWTAQNLSQPSIAAISGIAADSVWALTTTGSMLTTQDDGTSWSARPVPALANASGLRVVNAKRAWVATTMGTVSHTTDGGITWNTQVFDPLHTVDPIHVYTAIEVIPASSNEQEVVWAIGLDKTVQADKGYLRISNDGGANWSEYHVPVESITQVALVDKSNAWLIGIQTVQGNPTSVIFKTQDGGQTWKMVTWASSQRLTSITAIDANNAWAVAYDPTGAANSVIARIAPPQSVVTFVDSGTKQRLSSIATVDSTTLWIAGYDPAAAAQSVILKLDLSQGSPAVTSQTSGTTRPLTGIKAFDADTAWVFGADGTMLNTLNGGQ